MLMAADLSAATLGATHHRVCSPPAPLAAVDSEWKLINLTDNIMRLFRRTVAGPANPTWTTPPHR
jgi:hypothetical protein